MFIQRKGYRKGLIVIVFQTETLKRKKKRTFIGGTDQTISNDNKVVGKIYEVIQV